MRDSACVTVPHYGRLAALGARAAGRSCLGCLGQPVCQEALLRLGLREVERPAVGLAGLAVAAGPSQEIGAGGVEVAVVVEVEAVENGQAGLGPVDLGHGDGPVHVDDLGAGLPGQ